MIFRFISTSEFKTVFFTLLLSLSIFGGVTNAQGTASAVSIADFSGLDCESQRSQIDNLLIEIKDSPGSKGVIIIHGEYHDPITPYKQKSIITNHLKFRRFDINRIILLLGKSEPSFRTELWKVPTSELNRFTGEPWDFTSSGLKNTVLAHAESWIDGIGCSYTFDLTVYSEFLAANQNLSGRMIIRDKSIGNFNKIRTRLTNELVGKHKIAKDKIEFAFIQSEWSDIEYWYVPSDTFVRNTMQ